MEGIDKIIYNLLINSKHLMHSYVLKQCYHLSTRFYSHFFILYLSRDMLLRVRLCCSKKSSDQPQTEQLGAEGRVPGHLSGANEAVNRCSITFQGSNRQPSGHNLTSITDNNYYL